MVRILRLDPNLPRDQMIGLRQCRHPGSGLKRMAKARNDGDGHAAQTDKLDIEGRFLDFGAR